MLECGVTCFCMTEGVGCSSTCDVAARGVTHRETTSTKPSGRRGGAGRCRRDGASRFRRGEKFQNKKRNEKMKEKRQDLF